MTVIQRITTWARKQKRPLIIGISGHGAAGKTTFTSNLVTALQQQVNVLNTDAYIVPSAIRKLGRITYTYNGEQHTDYMTACHPSAHEVSFIERDVCMLRQQMDVLTLHTHYAPSERLSGKRAITIVEGMGVAFTDPALFDLLIYFYTDDETELARRLDRDVSERGADPSNLAKTHDKRRMQYELFMHPSHEHFHVVIKQTATGETIERLAIV